MEQKNSAVLCLVLATLFWAIGGVSWKIFSNLGFAFVLVFWVSRLFKFLSVLFISYYRVTVHEPVKGPREGGIILLNALFSIATPLFFFLAVSRTTVSNAYFLQFTMSAWVLVAAVLFLGEKITAKKTLALGLVLAGVLFIARPERLLSLNLGILFGLLSAVSYAGDIITARELKGYSYHTVSVYTNAMQFLIATVLLAILFQDFGALGIAPLGFAGMVVFGIILGIASDLYYQALHSLEASKAAIIAHLELFFACILAFFIFGESPTGAELLGYGAIFAASVVIVLRKSDIGHFERLLHLADKK